VATTRRGNDTRTKINGSIGNFSELQNLFNGGGSNNIAMTFSLPAPPEIKGLVLSIAPLSYFSPIFIILFSFFFLLLVLILVDGTSGPGVLIR